MISIIKSNKDNTNNIIINNITQEAKEGKSKLKEEISAVEMANVFSKIDIPEQLKNSVRLLLLSEQNNILTRVLKRLNGDRHMWEKAQKDPVLLLQLIAQEQQESMNELQRRIGAEMEKRKAKEEVAAAGTGTGTTTTTA